MEFTSNFSPLQLFPLLRHGGLLQPPRITSSEIQPSCTAISQIRSSFRAAPRRARERQHARTARKGGKRGETKKSMALPNVVAQFWRIKVFSNRLTVEPHPLSLLLDSSKRRAHSGMESCRKWSLSTVTHSVGSFFLFFFFLLCSRRNVLRLYCSRCNEK